MRSQAWRIADKSGLQAACGSRCKVTMRQSRPAPSVTWRSSLRRNPSVAVAGGTYNVGVGQTYPSLSEAVADLNHRGISGAVSLNLTDAVYDTTVAGGNNIFPIVAI